MTDTIPPAMLQNLRRYNQEHLVAWWDELNPEERTALVEQLQTIDFASIQNLIPQNRPVAQEGAVPDDARLSGAKPPSGIIRLPKTPAEQADWDDAAKKGLELLSAGKVAVLVVAGGQGTRLGFDHPKGQYPIGPVSENSLFQVLAEQVLARSRQASARIPYYVMTSEATDKETREFFRAHGHFGLDAQDVCFFQQGTMPAVDAKTGRVLLAAKGRVCRSPDGHGGTLDALANADLFDHMRQRGVDYLFYHHVDNPTVIVCDPTFLGFHALREAEMSAKVLAKRDAEEPIGVVARMGDRLEVIEYSDLPKSLATQCDSSGNLLLWAGSPGIHVFNRAFLEGLRRDKTALPFHLARKSVPCLDETGKDVDPDEPNAFKFERFIFDVLPLTRRALLVETDRAREFNPVKNRTGPDSPATAKQAMVSIFRDWLHQAGARIEPHVPVEISPLFALDAEQLCQKINRDTQFTAPVYLEIQD